MIAIAFIETKQVDEIFQKALFQPQQADLIVNRLHFILAILEFFLVVALPCQRFNLAHGKAETAVMADIGKCDEILKRVGMILIVQHIRIEQTGADIIVQACSINFKSPG